MITPAIKGHFLPPLRKQQKQRLQKKLECLVSGSTGCQDYVAPIKEAPPLFKRQQLFRQTSRKVPAIHLEPISSQYLKASLQKLPKMDTTTLSKKPLPPIQKPPQKRQQQQQQQKKQKSQQQQTKQKQAQDASNNRISVQDNLKKLQQLLAKKYSVNLNT